LLALPRTLVAGNIFHGLWDMLLRLQGMQTVIPHGCVPCCLLFDISIGILIFSWWQLVSAGVQWKARFGRRRRGRAARKARAADPA
jgi:hypothetical protein